MGVMATIDDERRRVNVLVLTIDAVLLLLLATSQRCC